MGGNDMIKKIKHKSIKTMFKGIAYRSKMEADFAKFLDEHNIEFQYEKERYVLSNGKSLWIDFYLPETKQYIEVKGIMQEGDLENHELFCEEFDRDILLLGSNVCVFYFHWEAYDDEPRSVMNDMSIQIGHCSNCLRWFLAPVSGNWGCPICRKSNGKQDLKYREIKGLKQLIEMSNLYVN